MASGLACAAHGRTVSCRGVERSLWSFRAPFGKHSLVEGWAAGMLSSAGSRKPTEVRVPNTTRSGCPGCVHSDSTQGPKRRMRTCIDTLACGIPNEFPGFAMQAMQCPRGEAKKNLHSKPGMRARRMYGVPGSPRTYPIRTGGQNHWPPSTTSTRPASSTCEYF